MKTLHAAYRVTDLAASLGFYETLGYEVVGRVDLDGGASLTMLMFPTEEFVSLELVHRPTDKPVDLGTGFSHLPYRWTTSSGRSSRSRERVCGPARSKSRVAPTARAPRS
jgi:lactoylglutathione lyase